MKQVKLSLIPLLMAVVMMAMSPTRVWAELTSSPSNFMVMSDMHVMSKSLFDDGTAFANYVQTESKLVENSQDVFDAAIAKIKTAKPDFLLIPGDLTKDGEKVSHEYVAVKLKELVALGIKVYVIPGNHDIGNPNAKSYLGETVTKVTSLTADEFLSADFYQSCGYASAVMTSGLSYMAYPADGIALIALDSRKPDTETTHYSEGGLTEATLAWAETAAAKARKEGRVVIGMMHHPVVEHFDGHKDFAPTDLANQAEEYPALADDGEVAGVQKRLVVAGIGTMFTGHFHLQSIQYEETSAGTLYDVMTGSLSAYPMAMRSGTIATNGNITVASITDVASSELISKAKARNAITTQGVFAVLANKMAAKISALKNTFQEFPAYFPNTPSTQAEIMALLNNHMKESYEVLMNSLALGDEDKSDPNTKIAACTAAYDAFLDEMFNGASIANPKELFTDITALNAAMVTSVFGNNKGTGPVIADNTNTSVKTIPLATIDAATWKTVLAEINEARAEYGETYTITFANSYSGTPTYTESVGAGVNIYNDSESDYNYVVAPTTAGDVIIVPADYDELFKDLTNLTSITFDNFNTSNVTDLSSMITNCTGLQHIYVHYNDVETYKAAMSSYADIISWLPEPATPVYAADGTTIDHYEIGNAGQLLWFSEFVNTKVEDSYPNISANAVLTADIVVNDGTFDADGNFTATGAGETSTPISVTPIGTNAQNSYKGTFDGNGHTISELYFAGGVDDEYIGLFGYICKGGVVKRLGVTNVYFSGSAVNSYVGGIAGFNDGTIENCYSMGVLQNTGSDTPLTGGICGFNSATIKNCYSTISTASEFVYGSSDDEATVTNSYTNGNAQAADFASGKIAYLFNGSRSEGTAESPLVWYQRLGDDGDDYPVLKEASDGSNTVYYGYDECLLTYANSTLSQTQGAHDYSSKILDETHEDENTGLHSYLCDKCGALSELVKIIKDYAPNAEGSAKNLELIVTKNGETTTYSTSETINLTDANQFGGNVKVEFTTPYAPTYTRTEMNTEWGTIVLPFAVETQNDDYALYISETILDGRLVLRIPNEQTVPAGVPMFIRKKTDATSITFTSTDNIVNTADRATPSIGTALIVVGTYTALPMTNADANNYFIYNNAFWNVNQLKDGQTVTILPFHAYIKGASDPGPDPLMSPKLQMTLKDEPMGISPFKKVQLRTGNDKCYNMNGQQISTPMRGVNVINGVRVMVK